MGLARRLALFAMLAALLAVPASASGQTRIIGGSDAAAGEFPYQVLLDSNGFQCGGSIIDGTHVVTAAHCVEDTGPSGYPEIFDPSTITVFYGGVDRPGGSSDMTSVDVDVVSVDRRRNRNLGGDEYDSAVLTLASNILPSANTARIELASAGQLSAALLNTDPADEPWITGWGLTDAADDNSVSEILQKVRVPLVGDGACNADYGGGLAPSVMLCAGDRTAGGRDTCQGDSGGPLAIDTDEGAGEDLRLAGITSFGEDCGNADFPGVYTEVPEAGTTAFLTSSPPAAPAVLGFPRATGTPRVGQTVTCVPPALPAGVSVQSYFWYVFNSAGDYSGFAQGSSASAVLPAAARGLSVECDVRLENDGGYQYLEGTPGAIGPVAAAPGGTTPAKDTTKPRARIQRVRCGRRRRGARRCTVTIKATDVGGVVRRVSARVKGRSRRCRRRADGTRRCRTRRLNKRLRLGKRKGGIYVGRIKLRGGRYAAYARARDSSGNRSKLARKRFRVR